MLFKTNIYALVSDEKVTGRACKKVIIWDEKAGESKQEILFKFEVLAVLMRKDILVVICESQSYIYTLSNLQCTMVVETCANPRGLGALSVKDPINELGRWIFVRPYTRKGHVKLEIG